MTSSKSPSYPWYPRDAMVAFERLSPDAELAARRLLDFQWLESALPADPRRLADLNRKLPPTRWRRAWAEIESLFPVADDDPTIRQNRRMERVRAEREAFQESQSLRGKMGAQARWSALKDAPANASAIGGSNASAIGGGMEAPLAEAMPADSLASASASASASSSPSSSVAAARAELIRRLAGEPNRSDVAVFFENLPRGQTEFVWSRILIACLDGDGLPGGRPATTAALMAACRDFLALGGERWSPRHFRGCVTAAMREAAQRPPSGNPPPAVSQAAKSEATWLAGRR